MTRIGAEEAEILTCLAEHESATVSEIGQACGVMPVSVRGRLVILEKRGLVSGRPNDAVRPVRVYTITAEGLRKVEA